jgi:hypothetical protein
MAGSRSSGSKLPPQPPSFWEQYKEHVRTPAAILLADGTLILLGVLLMLLVRIALLGFLATGAPSNIIGLFETGDMYLTMLFLLILGIDTLIKIIAFVNGGHKK